MFELTGFQRDLLYVVAGQDRPSGQDVKDALTDTIGSVGHGRLYPNLDTLVERGLVEKGEIDRRTNYYEITEAGIRKLEERRRWEDEQVGEAVEWG